VFQRVLRSAAIFVVVCVEGCVAGCVAVCVAASSRQSVQHVLCAVAADTRRRAYHSPLTQPYLDITAMPICGCTVEIAAPVVVAGLYPVEKESESE